MSSPAAAQVAAAGPRIDVGSAVVDVDGTATVEATLHSGGKIVGALANRVLYDSRVVQLAGLGACTIDRGIGSNAPGCKQDPPVGLCLVLNRNILNCGERPDVFGCEGQPPYMSMFIGLIFDQAEVPPREIPDGSTLYRCKFDVVDPTALPTLLSNVWSDFSDPIGNNLVGSGTDGWISSDGTAPPTWTPYATPTPASSGDGCRAHHHCRSGICDPSRPQVGYIGTCVETATPTPLASFVCATDDDCEDLELCNVVEGHICCNERVCPEGSSCRIPGAEGLCTSIATSTPAAPTPTATPVSRRSAVIYYGMDVSLPAKRIVLTATLSGENFRALSNDLIYDARVLQPSGEHPCRIADAVSDRHPECDVYPIVLPCLGLLTHADTCSDYPWLASCQGDGVFQSRVHVRLLPFDASNETPIPDGAELFTCSFDIIDPSLLPTSIELMEPSVASADHESVEVQVRNRDAGDEVSAHVLTVEAPAVETGGGGDGCAISADQSSGEWIMVAAFLFTAACRFRARLKTQPPTDPSRRA